MKVVYPPAVVDFAETTIFLAGTIEMGNSTNWQQELVENFKDFDVTFLNPRRKDWDITWEQKKENKMFFDQVDWELNGIEKADFVIMYFDPSSKSPVSLLELGLISRMSSKVIVCCPEGFWRKGNVDIVCNRYGISHFDSLDSFKCKLKEMLLAQKRGLGDGKQYV